MKIISYCFLTIIILFAACKKIYEPLDDFAEKIAFVSTRGSNQSIYLMNIDGSNQIQLTKNSIQDNAPAFSPDGKKLAFTSYRDDNYDIYLIES